MLAITQIAADVFRGLASYLYYPNGVIRFVF